VDEARASQNSVNRKKVSHVSQLSTDPFGHMGVLHVVYKAVPCRAAQHSTAQHGNGNGNGKLK